MPDVGLLMPTSRLGSHGFARPSFPISTNLCLMPSFRAREGTAFSTLAAVIRGEGWTASSVRNPVLRKNHRRLGRAFCRSNKTTDSLREPCLGLISIVIERSDLLETPTPLGRDLISALLRVGAYADRWIRSPDEWEPSGDDLWVDLLRHLFVQWKLPAFFESAWLTNGPLRHLERDWYCDVAIGLNWRKLDHVPASVSKRAVHFAMMAPDQLTARAALRWGQLTVLGASQELIEAVLQSCVVNNLANDEVWSRLFEKVVRAPWFDPRDFGLMADVFERLHQRYQFNRARDLVGLPLKDLLTHCRQYWRRLLEDALADGLKFRTRDLREAGLRMNLQHFTDAHWEAMEDVRDEEIEHRTGTGRESHWQVSQLTRHSQLVAEGLAMNHCVGGYRRRCQRKNSAIFSLGHVEMESGCRRVKRKVTVEVSRRSRLIVQARRRWNHWPSELEREVIAIWARNNEIEVRI